MNKKLKFIIAMIVFELMAFGYAIVFSIVLTSQVPQINPLALILATEMFFHGLLAFTEIKRMKQPPTAEGDL